jgi:hypothetical protein
MHSVSHDSCALNRRASRCGGRISGAGIGDYKADVEIVSGGESPDEILPRDIKHDDSMLHTVTLAKFNAYFLKQVLPPRHEDNIDS